MYDFLQKKCDLRQDFINWSRDRDLNPGPPPYHGGALPLSYHGVNNRCILQDWPLLS
jgi:hypothetical protein